jgi:hypothetical protein
MRALARCATLAWKDVVCGEVARRLRAVAAAKIWRGKGCRCAMVAWGEYAERRRVKNNRQVTFSHTFVCTCASLFYVLDSV